jgi:transketolase
MILGKMITMKFNELNNIASLIRAQIIKMCHNSKSAHLGSCLSCVDILVSIYWGRLNLNPLKPKCITRDRFILSKGHAAMALYATLAQKGYFNDNLLSTYNQNGGDFAEHPPANLIPGVEAATGSLGHGLPIGIGMSLAGKINKLDYKTIVLLSDGENNEGSVWEGAMFAASNELSNLYAIIDYNKWQATGRSNEVLALDPLKEKWTAFGWDSIEVDGHDIAKLQKILNKENLNNKPTCIIAHTIKGKGVSFMEDDNNWHYRVPSKDEVQLSLKELGLL